MYQNIVAALFIKRYRARSDPFYDKSGYAQCCRNCIAVFFLLFKDESK